MSCHKKLTEANEKLSSLTGNVSGFVNDLIAARGSISYCHISPTPCTIHRLLGGEYYSATLLCYITVLYLFNIHFIIHFLSMYLFYIKLHSWSSKINFSNIKDEKLAAPKNCEKMLYFLQWRQRMEKIQITLIWHENDAFEHFFTANTKEQLVEIRTTVD